MLDYRASNINLQVWKYESCVSQDNFDKSNFVNSYIVILGVLELSEAFENKFIVLLLSSASLLDTYITMLGELQGPMLGLRHVNA